MAALVQIERRGRRRRASLFSRLCLTGALFILSLVLVGCSSTPAPPDALVSYLQLLADGRPSDAYERTQLAQIGAFTRAAALGRDHFVAFFEADPVTGYDIGHVVHFEPEGQDAFWEVEVTLHTEAGSRTEDYQVEGRVLAVVNVQPIRLLLEVPGAGAPEVAVDGFPVDVSDAKIASKEATWQILVLNGPHRLTVGSHEIDVSTSPPRVFAGPGRFIGAGDVGGATLTLRVG